MSTSGTNSEQELLPAAKMPEPALARESDNSSPPVVVVDNPKPVAVRDAQSQPSQVIGKVLSLLSSIGNLALMVLENRQSTAPATTATRSDRSAVIEGGRGATVSSGTGGGRQRRRHRQRRRGQR